MFTSNYHRNYKSNHVRASELPIESENSGGEKIYGGDVAWPEPVDGKNFALSGLFRVEFIVKIIQIKIMMIQTYVPS